MQIQIVSKNIDVSRALSERITSRLEEMIDKYIHRDGEAHVAVSKEGSGFRSVVSVHLPSGASLQSQGEAQEAYPATDEALEHMEKRLRRYKRRLKDHNADGKTAAKEAAFAMFVMENPATADDMSGSDADAPTAPDEPMIIAQGHGRVRTMTPGMAALEVGMADSGVVVFRNAKHGRTNVIFKRGDGNIGWIDPEPPA